MGKNLFKIDESEKQRILEMHQSATRKQYLGEQGAPAPTTTAATSAPTTTATTTAAPVSPALAPFGINTIVVDGNRKLNLYNDRQLMTLNVNVKPAKDDKGVVIPKSYKIWVTAPGIAGLQYYFKYNCGDKNIKATINTPQTIDNAKIYARLDNTTDYKNEMIRMYDGTERNQLISILRQSTQWDVSSFGGELEKLCS